MKYNKDNGQEERIDRLLRERIGAPSGENIREELDEVWLRISETMETKKETKRATPFYLLWMRATAVAAAMVIALFLVPELRHSAPNDIAEITKSKEQPSGCVAAVTEPPAVVDNVTTATARHSKLKAVPVHGTIVKDVTPAELAGTQDIAATDDNEPQKLDSVPIEKGIDETDKADLVGPSPLGADYASFRSKSDNNGAFGECSLLAYAGGGRSIGTSDIVGGMKLRKATMPKLTFDDDGGSAFLYDRAEFRHDIPLKLGVNVLINIEQSRVGIETGINYSYLHSKATYEESNKPQIRHQNLHYIGVPLGVRFTAYSNNAISLYVGASGELDKAVSATLGGQSLGVLPWSWSLHGRAGATVRIAPNISLYAEPSVSYYFKDGSRLKSYYNQNPLVLTFSIGVLFTPSIHF